MSLRCIEEHNAADIKELDTSADHASSEDEGRSDSFSKKALVTSLRSQLQSGSLNMPPGDLCNMRPSRAWMKMSMVSHSIGLFKEGTLYDEVAKKDREELDFMLHHRAYTWTSEQVRIPTLCMRVLPLVMPRHVAASSTPTQAGGLCKVLEGLYAKGHVLKWLSLGTWQQQIPLRCSLSNCPQSPAMGQHSHSPRSP